MVYKKYIKKDGKLYGPYIYHSKRVDGKVISEYCGPGTKPKRKFIFLTIGILIFLGLVILAFNFKSNMTGNVILSNPSQNFIQNSSEELTLTLKQGEFIPSSTKLIFSDSSNSYEYPLEELVIEQQEKGNYYIQGESLSGEGNGYGLAGTIKTYPKVSFILISKTQSSNSNNSPQDLSPIKENNLSSDNQLEENNLSNQEIPIYNPEESSSLSNTESDLLKDDSSLDLNTESNKSEENIPQEDIPKEDSGIIPQLLETVSNFFLSIGITGNVIESESESFIKEIPGESSELEEFSYSLNEGESVELLSGSVKLDSKTLDDNIITLIIKDQKVIIKINYSLIEEGFGEEYLGDQEKILKLKIPQEINLSDNYNIKLIYSSNSQEKEIPKEVIPVPQEVLILNPENTTKNLSLNLNFYENLSLSNQEREFLNKKFNGSLIKTTNSETFNGRYIISYSLGDYTIKYSYDLSLDKESLEIQMEKDRVKWLKDIYNKLIEEENLPKPSLEFNSDFNL